MDNIKEQMCKLLDKAFDEGYAQSYEDNNKNYMIGITEMYKQGLNDAWECARKIDTNRDLEVFVFGKDLEKGYEDILPSEAIAKIKEYEGKHKGKSCLECGQPRDNHNKCLLWENGTCKSGHTEWRPK